MKILGWIKSKIAFRVARVVRRLIGDYWKPRRCGWPYPSGYATYNKYRNAVLDTGLTEEEAIYRCKILNGA